MCSPSVQTNILKKITAGWQSCLFLMKLLLLLPVQVQAERWKSLQPMDNQSSNTNPQQPNSCHPSLLYLPHSLLNKIPSIPTVAPHLQAHSPRIGQSGRRSNWDHTCKHWKEEKAVVRDLRYEGVTGGSPSLEPQLIALLINNTTLLCLTVHHFHCKTQETQQMYLLP